MSDAYAIQYLKLLDIQQYLSDTHEIEDIERYAFDWLVLAKQFEEIGAIHAAAAARSRGEYYASQAPGEYIRIIEGPLSELISTEA